MQNKRKNKVEFLRQNSRMNGFSEFAGAFIKDSGARHRIINLFAFLLNICYIYFNLISGIIYENILSVTVSAYYIITVFVRYLIIGEAGASETSQMKETAQIASYLLLVLAFPIAGIIFYTLATGKTKEYPIWILTILGVYSFFTVFRSVLGLKAAVKKTSITMRTAYSARLSAALMSLFNFQTSFLSAVLQNSQIEARLNLTLGIFISASVFSLALRAQKRRK